METPIHGTPGVVPLPVAPREPARALRVLSGRVVAHTITNALYGPEKGLNVDVRGSLMPLAPQAEGPLENLSRLLENLGC
jgi:hypothetical protein